MRHQKDLLIISWHDSRIKQSQYLFIPKPFGLRIQHGGSRLDSNTAEIRFARMAKV
jgi:hypothetical protein